MCELKVQCDDGHVTFVLHGEPHLREKKFFLGFMWRRVQYSNNWVWTFSVPVPLDLKTALCGPYSDVKSWQPWSFTAVPDCPQTQAPNIIQIQRKGTQINLIRDVSFPEPSMCLKSPSKRNPSSFPFGGPYFDLDWTETNLFGHV